MTTDEATPKFDPTWLRGQPVAKWVDMFGMPKDVNDAKDEEEPQRDTRLTEAGDARMVEAGLETEEMDVNYVDGMGRKVSVVVSRRITPWRLQSEGSREYFAGRVRALCAERDRARATAVQLEAGIARVRNLMQQWADQLSQGCPSCGPFEQNCDHIEGYHHALADLSKAIGEKWNDPT